METATKEEEKKSLKDYDCTSESPYIVNLYGKYSQPKEDHKVMYDDQGEAWGTYKIPKGKVVAVDTAKYTKLMGGNTSVLMTMSEPAARMFYYITANIKPNKDEICIMQEDYLAFAGYKAKSRLTYYRALEGLLKAEIIARKTGGGVCYWVNPNILFNGDRTKLKNVIVHPPTDTFTGFGNRREEV